MTTSTIAHAGHRRARRERPAPGLLLDLASSSPRERLGWAPFTPVLLLSTLLISRGGIARRTGGIE